MNAGAASRILGFDIEVTRQPDGHYVAESNWEFGTEYVHRAKREQAIRDLVDVIYKLRKAYVMRRQKFRCAECDRIAPLECDHVELRSHGRTDKLENLRGLCSHCHRIKHGG